MSQAKVQQLYKLDRLLQEESGTLHSLQQDKVGIGDAHVATMTRSLVKIEEFAPREFRVFPRHRMKRSIDECTEKKFRVSLGRKFLLAKTILPERRQYFRATRSRAKIIYLFYPRRSS